LPTHRARHVLGAADQDHGPGERAASAPGRQPPVRGRGRGASPGAGRGHRPPNPSAQGPSWAPRATPSPYQLPPGPRWCLVPGGIKFPLLASLIAQLVVIASNRQNRDQRSAGMGYFDGSAMAMTVPVPVEGCWLLVVESSKSKSKSKLLAVGPTPTPTLTCANKPD
jgi:hypothetical protein